MLTKSEMKNHMVDGFLFIHKNSYSLIWPQITLSNLEEILQSIIGHHSISSHFKDGVYIVVDFAIGVGKYVGSPTSTKFITVYLSDKKLKEDPQRFTVKELRLAIIERLKLNAPITKGYEQLSLFEVI